MAFVRSFNDFAPPKRFDATAFTTALIQEAPASTGPWSTIETIDLAAGPGVTPTGLDTDPSSPQSRDLTTNSATLDPKGWYRIVWRDAALNIFNGDPILFDDTPNALCTVDDVLRILRIGSVSDAEEARIQAAIQTGISWAKKVLHDPDLGSTDASVKQYFFGESVLPYTGDLVSVTAIQYPGATETPISSDAYWTNGKQIRILNANWMWPGLPADERYIHRALEDWQIVVETNRSNWTVDPLVRDAIAYAAAALWTRGPRLGKGLSSESIGDYSYSISNLVRGVSVDPFFTEATRLLGAYGRSRTGLVVP